MRSVITSAVAAAGLSTLCAGAALAQLSYNLQVRVGVSAVLPDESAGITTISGDADISDACAPGVQLEWFST